MDRKPKKICNDTELLSNFNQKDLETLEKERLGFMIMKSRPNTSEIYKTINLPHRFDCPYLSMSYGKNREERNPLFRTVNSEYGYLPPNVHTVPTSYYPRGQKFSNLIVKFGMYNDYTLNSSLAQ